MLPVFVISSVEIYVIATLVAAAVVALCVRPSSRGQAREYLLEGILCNTSDQSENADLPPKGISVECLENGNVLLTRFGLERLTDTAAVSLAVTVIGFDITIQDRIHEGMNDGEPINTALFTLDFLGRERYHLRYISEPTASALSMTLSNRPGISLTRPLILNS